MVLFNILCRYRAFGSYQLISTEASCGWGVRVSVSYITSVRLILAEYKSYLSRNSQLCTSYIIMLWARRKWYQTHTKFFAFGKCTSFYYNHDLLHTRWKHETVCRALYLQNHILHSRPSSYFVKNAPIFNKVKIALEIWRTLILETTVMYARLKLHIYMHCINKHRCHKHIAVQIPGVLGNYQKMQQDCSTSCY